MYIYSDNNKKIITLYLANIGKVKPFQKLIEKQPFHLLKKPRKSHQLLQRYGTWKKVLSNNYLFWFTRREHYRNSSSHVSKAKDKETSSTLISDEDSIVQHLKRSDLQCLIWKRCMKLNVIIAKPKRHGCYMKDENFFQFGMLESNYL